MRLIVIGGGAAGFFCSITAARLNPEMEVILLEKTGKLLCKVRISGGGRCNVTHACFSIPEMAKKYPRGGNFVKRTFHEFFTEDTIVWFKERGVLLKTEEDGRMFPVSNTSETIAGCLMSEADQYNVQIRLNRDVKAISKKDDQWELQLSDEEKLVADYVCVACGGYPKDTMFEWLRRTGHSMETPVPSLFTFNILNHPLKELMGIAASARVKIAGSKLEEEGPVLITHWGLSGPAVLKLSSRGARDLAAVNYRFNIIVNWCPGYHEGSLKEKFSEFRALAATQKVMNRNGIGLPSRLWEYLCGISEIDNTIRWADLPSVRENKLIKNICLLELKIEGKTTFKEEFVTAGGIKLSEIDPLSMQSRIAPGLFFAGEIMDVDGVTGGFNFQHAWTSGWIAGKSIASHASAAMDK